MPPTAAEILDQLESSTRALLEASAAAITLARAIVRDSQARTADDDEWTRMPLHPHRCPVSRWSRGTLDRRTKDGPRGEPPQVRRKSVGSTVYYSLADVRRLIAGAPASHPITPPHP